MKVPDSDSGYQALVKRYQARIPSSLRDLLVPPEAQWKRFAKALKRLRMQEEERAYVTEIQLRFGIPYRPNESVKRTMIRVRLAILRKRRKTGPIDTTDDHHRQLPTDPLE